jgi:hypothetical protein
VTLVAVACEGYLRNDPPPPTRIVIAPARVQIAVGDSARLGATAYDDDGRVVTRWVFPYWSSDAAEVARIDSVQGWVVGRTPGQATIRVRGRANVRDTATVVVTPAGR